MKRRQGLPRFSRVVPDAEAFLQLPSDSDRSTQPRNIPVQCLRIAFLGRGHACSRPAGRILGSWDAVWQAMEKDDCGNASKRDVYSSKARLQLTLAPAKGGRLLACVGTNDGSRLPPRRTIRRSGGYIAPARAGHQGTRVAYQVPEKSPKRMRTERCVARGAFYDSIDQGDRFHRVKRNCCEAGRAPVAAEMLHHHRAEHWIVVNGTVLVTRGEEQFLLGENEPTYIPLGIRTGSRIQVAFRFRSLKCSPEPISAKTTSSDSTISMAVLVDRPWRTRERTRGTAMRLITGPDGQLHVRCGDDPRRRGCRVSHPLRRFRATTLLPGIRRVRGGVLRSRCFRRWALYQSRRGRPETRSRRAGGARLAAWCRPARLR